MLRLDGDLADLYRCQRGRSPQSDPVPLQSRVYRRHPVGRPRPGDVADLCERLAASASAVAESAQRRPAVALAKVLTRERGTCPVDRPEREPRKQNGVWWPM